MIARALAAAAMLLCAALPARAVPLFDKEAAIVLSSVTAQAFTGEATYAPLRMYYIAAVSSDSPHASSGTAVLSATSVDGVAFTPEAGVRLATTTVPSVSASSITGCSLLSLSGGGFRMVYSIVSTTGAFRIHSATSADGLAWANETRVVVDGGASYVGVPRLVKLTSGDWRMYYTADFDGGNQLADRRILTTRSTDEGVNWGAPTMVVSTIAYESGASLLTDGRVRLFYTQPATGISSASVILSAISNDAVGNLFSTEPGVRLSTPSTTGGLAFPVPVRSTDSFRWRLYYSFFLVQQSTGDLRSALVGRPAPSAITPTLVFNNSAAGTFTISGDAFSTGPAVKLTRGAVTIVGTGVTRVSDQTITATFNMQNQALGAYDLTVTNADGIADVLTSAVTLDFAPGSMLVTGNLLRPRSGGTTAVDVTIFNPGFVQVRIRDADGKLIRTLLDANEPAGTVRVNWDGKDSSGASVPSGVYLVTTTGPKLTAKAKIVVIR